MKLKSTIPLLVLVSFMIVPALMASVSATTSEQAIAAGAGFHEPSNDWYDITYKHRIPINITALDKVDTNLTSVNLDFSDYFDDGDGIIDLASMQLTRMAPNQTSIPVKYQLDTDAVDIWNAPTLQDVEDIILGSLVADNATYIGTTFNLYKGSGLMNQSIRFETYLKETRNEVKFQFVYDAAQAKNIGTNDYLFVYAGVPSHWGTPIRIYKSMLPSVNAWTNYYTLPLEMPMSGYVWIVMEAPSLYGNSIKFFSIDFSFLDGSGFNRTTEHFLPELDIPGKTIHQDNYYPRVQVLEHENMPECTIHFNNIDESGDSPTLYYLYFNFMNESNHRLIYNDVVPFSGELSIPQAYFKKIIDNVTLIIDKDGIDEWEGCAQLSTPEDILIDHLMQVIGMSGGETGYDVYNKFGTVYSQAIYKTDEMTITMTLYEGCDFIDIAIQKSGADIEILNIISYAMTDRPLTIVGDDDSFTSVTSGTPFTGTGHRIEMVNPDNETYVTVLFDKLIDYEVKNIDLINGVHDLYFYPGTTTVIASVHITEAGALYSDDSGDSILDESSKMQELFDARIANPYLKSIGGLESFSGLEIFVLNAKTGLFAYHLVGDKIQIALFGNNLQSISVKIDGKTSEIATNGTFTIPSFSHTFFEASYKFIFKGRNEFGLSDTYEVNLVVADNTLDVLRALFISTILLPIFGIGAVSLTTVSIAINKRSIKKDRMKECNEGLDGKCVLD